MVLSNLVFDGHLGCPMKDGKSNKLLINTNIFIIYTIIKIEITLFFLDNFS